MTSEREKLKHLQLHLPEFRCTASLTSYTWWSVFRVYPASKFTVYLHMRIDGNFVIGIVWIVLCWVNNFPGIEQTLYKMHVGILHIRKYFEQHCHKTQHNHASANYNLIENRKVSGVSDRYSRTHPLGVASRHASMRLPQDYNLPNFKTV